MSTTRPATLFRSLYGAGPVHLVGLLLTFVVALYAFVRVYDADSQFWWRYALWFVGAAVVHDLVLAPAYLAADRGLRRLRAARPTMSPGAVNYVRVPVVLSGMLFLVFGASILQRGEAAFGVAAGKDQDPFLGRWLVVTAVLFAGSAVAYGVSRLRASRRAAPTA